MIYYHYTTKQSHDEIKGSGKFLPSFFSRALDSQYGPGWYFTDLTPDEANEELYQLWGGQEPEKVQYFLEFEIDPSVLEYCRPHVYRLPDSRLRDAHLVTSQEYYSENKLVIALKRFGNRILQFFGLQRTSR